MAGGQVTEGGAASCTITCWVQKLVLPARSVAVQMTVLVPSGNCVGALPDTETVPELSLAVGVPKLTAVAKHWPGSVETVTFGGQVNIGGNVSATAKVSTCSIRLELPL